jgi:hypothetical protein
MPENPYVRADGIVKRLTPIAVGIAVVLLVVGGYVWAYLALGRVSTAPTPRGPTVIERNYPHHWEMRLFTPAAKVEGSLLGHNVQATWGAIP